MDIIVYIGALITLIILFFHTQATKIQFIFTMRVIKNSFALRLLDFIVTGAFLLFNLVSISELLNHNYIPLFLNLYYFLVPYWLYIILFLSFIIIYFDQDIAHWLTKSSTTQKKAKISTNKLKRKTYLLKTIIFLIGYALLFAIVLV